MTAKAFTLSPTPSRAQARAHGKGEHASVAQRRADLLWTSGGVDLE